MGGDLGHKGDHWWEGIWDIRGPLVGGDLGHKGNHWWERTWGYWDGNGRHERPWALYLSSKYMRCILAHDYKNWR